MAIIGRHTIGQMLIQAGKIDNNQLQSALNMQEEQDAYLGAIFKKLGGLYPFGPQASSLPPKLVF